MEMSLSWYLEGYFGSETALSRVHINHFPFQIGRQSGLGFTVPSDSVSRFHAEINLKDGELELTDYGSTNGTFVNRDVLEQETGKVVHHGDILHFGEFEVRLIEERSVLQKTINNSALTRVGIEGLPDQLPTGYHELQELIGEQAVYPVFQPIVATSDDAIHAYEILGRGCHPKLSESPGPLFMIAESFDLAVDLSELFRDKGVSRAASFHADQKFFLNIHPDEHYDNDRLLRQLETLRHTYPDLGLVLEIHEESAPDLDGIKQMIRTLESLDIEFAYDDFGAGQARLLELVEAPANYLKFDIAMVRGIDQAPRAKRDMLAALIEQAKKVGTLTLAEGLDREEEVRACKDLGFDFIQGFYYGRPSVELQADRPVSATG